MKPLSIVYPSIYFESSFFYPLTTNIEFFHLHIFHIFIDHKKHVLNLPGFLGALYKKCQETCVKNDFICFNTCILKNNIFSKESIKDSTDKAKHR